MKNLNKKIRTVLASLDLGLAEEELDFLGNILFEDSPDFIDSGDEVFNTLLIFKTQEDAKVDDVICLPLQNQEFEFDDPLRPVIPDDTHPNCRCFWENAETGSNLGQDGAFASASLTKVTEEFADLVDGEEGVWRTLNGTPVFFPDGADPKEVIDKAFKGKSKSPKKERSKLQTTTRPQEELEQVEKFGGHRDEKTGNWIEDKEPKPVERTVDVQGMQVDIPDGEDEVSIIDDFRDKNELWVKVDQKEIEGMGKTDTHPLGRRLETAMEDHMGVSEPNGSAYLTTNGEWVGGKNHFGYDEDHRPQIREGLTRAGIKLTGQNKQGDFDGSSSMILGLEASGMVRIGARDDLSLDIYKPLTGSQRNSIQDHIIAKGLDFNDIHIDTNDTGISEQTILRSIGAFGSATADTVDGKEGEWKTINGTPVFIPDGEDAEKVISETFKKIKSKSPSPQAPKGKEPQRFSEARKSHQDFAKGKAGESYSFDPKTGKGYDAFNKDEAINMYNRYDKSDGKDPVYFISETNHGGQLSRESESAFVNITNQGNDPIIGRWVDDKTGFEYTDVGFSETGLGKKGSDRKIRDLLSETGQESALKLFPDGTVDFVNGF